LIPLRVKRPRVPFHLWLPEAHVEGPTFVSVLLSALLLKVSIYGRYRFIIGKFEVVFVEQQRVFLVLIRISCTYAALTTLRQTDIKRIIAYSSIVHRNFSLLGFRSYSVVGVKGTLLRRVAHAISSSALFILVGQIYNRTKTKNIYYINGLAKTAPRLSGFFRLFTLGTVGFPFTLNFVAELLIITSLSVFNKNVLFLCGGTLFVSIIYSFWLFTRVSFNSNRTKACIPILDASRHEFILLTCLGAPLVILGVYPGIILKRWV